MKGFRKAALGIIACGLVAVVLHHALAVGPYLDDTDGLQRFRQPAWRFDEHVAYYWATDHPAFCRWINHAALTLLGQQDCEIPPVNSVDGFRWNKEHGRLAPRGPVRVIRILNVAWLCGALFCLALLAKTVLGSWEWGLLAVAPLALSREFGGGLGSFIFGDAHLAFFLSLSALLWVRFHLKGKGCAWRSLAVMGVLSGLAVSCKHNAVFALAAYACYLVIVCRGVERAVKPLAFAATAFAVFVAVNPVMWQGGPLWWYSIAQDVVVHRFRRMAYQKTYYGESPLLTRLANIFDPLLALPLFAWLVWRARKQPWFLPVALWAGFLGIATVLTIHIPFNRYLMPVYVPLTLLVMLSTGTFCIARKQSTPLGPQRV